MALQGQVALVFGGASGIGLATVEELLQAGANVAVGDVAKEAGEAAVKQLQARFGSLRTTFIRVDVRSNEQVEDAFITTKQHFTKVDIFINSAGVLNDFQWELGVDINFNGIIRGTLAGWKYMGQHGGGSGGTVVNIASQLGLESFAGSPIYCGTKHGVIGFSRSCGEPYHVQRTGVRVITVCPALTQTPLVNESGPLQQLTEDMKKESYRAMSTFPTQKPENVARGIHHVLSARGQRERVGERGRRGHLRSGLPQAPGPARPHLKPPSPSSPTLVANTTPPIRTINSKTDISG